MNKNLCIYHGGCSDGFGSAHIVYNFFKKYEPNDSMKFYAGNYNDPPPYELAENKIVYLVDFTYKQEELRNLSNVAKKIIILDHHVSFLENESKNIERVGGGKDKEVEEYKFTDMENVSYFYSEKEFSGVGVVWDYFYSKQEMPILYQYIQDRDLWKWRFSDTKSILKGLDSYPQDFKIWNEFYHTKDLLPLLEIGNGIIRYEENQIKELIENVNYINTKYGQVPVVNCPGILTSEIGAILAKNYPFSIMYYFKEKYMIISLRSSTGGEDVSSIATKLKGGGHKRAAGFSLKNGTLSKLEVKLGGNKN